jgi:hypothetical protein
MPASQSVRRLQMNGNQQFSCNGTVEQANWGVTKLRFAFRAELIWRLETCLAMPNGLPDRSHRELTTPGTKGPAPPLGLASPPASSRNLPGNSAGAMIKCATRTGQRNTERNHSRNGRFEPSRGVNRSRLSGISPPTGRKTEHSWASRPTLVYSSVYAAEVACSRSRTSFGHFTALQTEL